MYISFYAQGNIIAKVFDAYESHAWTCVCLYSKSGITTLSAALGREGETRRRGVASSWGIIVQLQIIGQTLRVKGSAWQYVGTLQRSDSPSISVSLSLSLSLSLSVSLRLYSVHYVFCILVLGRGQTPRTGDSVAVAPTLPKMSD